MTKLLEFDFTIQYKRGLVKKWQMHYPGNSRKQAIPVWAQEVAENYTQDEFFRALV